MRINQRGTSTNLASLTAVATESPGSWVTDRWNVYRNGFIAGGVIGQGINLTASDLPFSDAGIKTFGRIGRLAGNTSVTPINLDYNMESQDCYKYIGKTVTLSFYYRTGANFSAGAFTAAIYTGTGTDQALRSTYTGAANTNANISTSTNWVRYSFTANISSAANQFSIEFYYTPTGTAGAADYFDITGVQLELGSVATPFEVRPYPVELQLCQRYYRKFFDLILVGNTNAGGSIIHTYMISPSLRISPSAGIITLTPAYANAYSLGFWAGNTSMIGLQINITNAGGGYAQFSLEINAEI